MKAKHLLVIMMLTTAHNTFSQCISNLENVYSYTLHYATYNIVYDIVKENKTWVDASACAVERGGALAEINSQEEQDSLFFHLNQANINVANTVAPDGGGASYVWLGGNDINSEGNWFWDGINAGSFNQFWQGTSSGAAVNNSYTNWGNEPDNWNNQDGLGLAVTNWPLGLAGQWNDVNENNQLYYVIESVHFGWGQPNVDTSVPEMQSSVFSVYPNPTENFITVKTLNEKIGSAYVLINICGATVLKGNLDTEITKINLSTLEKGIYLFLCKGQSYKVMKN